MRKHAIPPVGVIEGVFSTIKVSRLSVAATVPLTVPESFSLKVIESIAAMTGMFRMEALVEYYHYWFLCQLSGKAKWGRCTINREVCRYRMLWQLILAHTALLIRLVAVSMVGTFRFILNAVSLCMSFCMIPNIEVAWCWLRRCA